VSLPAEPEPGGVARRRGPVRPAVQDGWATHRLLGMAARLDKRQINRSLTPLGLTQGALDALASVAENEPVTVSDLAPLLCVSQQSLGKVILRLQRLGFLTRERGDDRRNAVVRLTQRGRSVLESAEGLVDGLPPTGTGSDGALHRQLEDFIGELKKYER
jgi:DNA-binding MarR family transcriptional regulator